MKLIIENMVCDRCIQSVRDLFDELNIETSAVSLGRVETAHSISVDDRYRLEKRLAERGFGLSQERDDQTVTEIRTALIDFLKEIEFGDDPGKLSDYISGRLYRNYSRLSHLYSSRTGETIEKHLIRLKIERVKELLAHRNRTLGEIAWKLKYSSVQYLSNQFRDVTGLTVTDYLKQENPVRTPLDRV
ncbi:MAG: AraC family transcriptional regulator [Balneolaceae bacterium]